MHGGINSVEVEKNLKGSDGNQPLQKESCWDCVEHSAGRQRRLEKRAACSS